MLLVLLSDNSFMLLVLYTITYRLENKHRATAAQTACVWAESAARLLIKGNFQVMDLLTLGHI